MRPGNSDSSVPNCSATTSGAWLGSMMPPAPTRIVVVPAATCAMTIDVAALAMPGMLWCSATQTRWIPEPLGVAREIERVAERGGGVAPRHDGSEVEHGEAHLRSLSYSHRRQQAAFRPSGLDSGGLSGG